MVDDERENPRFAAEVVEVSPVAACKDFADVVGVDGIGLFAIVPVGDQMAAVAVGRIRHGHEQTCGERVSA